MVANVIAAGAGRKSSRYQALCFSTVAFTLCFAVWTLFSIVGVRIKQELGLNDSEFGLLVATPVLTGALSRLFLGVLSDKFGGRRILALEGRLGRALRSEEVATLRGVADLATLISRAEAGAASPAGDKPGSGGMDRA